MFIFTGGGLVPAVGIFLIALTIVGFMMFVARAMIISPRELDEPESIDPSRLPGVRREKPTATRDSVNCSNFRCKAANPPHAKYCRLCGAYLSRELFPRSGGGR